MSIKQRMEIITSLSFKILQFLSTSEIGGTEKMILSLIKGQDKRFFQNEVCVLSSKGSLADEFEKETKIYYLNYGKVSIFEVIKRLFWLLKTNKYDIVHIYGLRANIIGRLIGSLCGCKNIVSGLRSMYMGEQSSSFVGSKTKITKRFRIFIETTIDKLTLPFIKFYISNTQKAVDFFIKNGYPPSKFRVVHNGIANFLDLTPDGLLQERFSKEKPILICVANLNPNKGHNLLINALKIVKDHNFAFKLLLVGDGELKDELVNLTLSLSLENEIIFLGKRNNVGQILSLGDIFILPSIIEGMPVSIMEACLAHLPVVAFDVGGISELVINGETGIIVPPLNVPGLAKAIEELLSNEEKRKRMGERGYNRIKEEFSLEKMVRSISAIYLELMQESKR